MSYTMPYVKPAPLHIKVTDHPVSLADWPYKWRIQNQHDFMDIDMDWDDDATRKLLYKKLNDLGVLFIEKLGHAGEIHGEQVYLFRIRYTFDLKDPELFAPTVFYRRPMYRFRTACISIRESLKHAAHPYCTDRDDLGLSYVEATPYFVLVAAKDICGKIFACGHRAFDPEYVRALVQQEGLDYDSYVLLPDVELKVDL